MKILLGKYKVADWATSSFTLAQDESGKYFYQMDTESNWWPLQEWQVSTASWLCLELYTDEKISKESVICAKIKRMEERQNARKQALSKLSV